MTRSQRWLWGLSIGIIILAALTYFWARTSSENDTCSLGLPIKPLVSVASSTPTLPNFTMLAFGDLMLDRNVGAKIKNNDIGFLLTDLQSANIFAHHDLISANLEGAVTNAGAHYLPQNAYDFAFVPAAVAKLKDYGFNFFNLANNHFSDQGQKGMAETRANLKQLGFNYSGSADAMVDGNSSLEEKINGVPVALVGLSMVYHPFDQKSAQKIIANYKAKGDIVIVNIHWGTEYQHNFSTIQKEVGHGLIDAGADIIIGHHPHVIEGMEIYKQHPIFYSLGNFIFDQYFSPDTQQGLALEAQYQAKSWQVKLIPLQSQASVPRVMTETEANVFWSKFLSWSKITADQLKALSGDGLTISQ